MSANDDETTSTNATGTRPPVFNAGEDKYLHWVRLVGLWYDNKTDKEKLKAGGQLVLAQNVYAVQEIMMRVSNDELNTVEGVEKVIDVMNAEYAKDKEHLAWMAFFAFYTGKRTKGESCNDYKRRLTNRYSKLQGLDSE